MLQFIIFIIFIIFSILIDPYIEQGQVIGKERFKLFQSFVILESMYEILMISCLAKLKVFYPDILMLLNHICQNTSKIDIVQNSE